MAKQQAQKNPRVFLLSPTVGTLIVTNTRILFSSGGTYVTLHSQISQVELCANGIRVLKGDFFEIYGVDPNKAIAIFLTIRYLVFGDTSLDQVRAYSQYAF